MTVTGRSLLEAAGHARDSDLEMDTRQLVRFRPKAADYDVSPTAPDSVDISFIEPVLRNPVSFDTVY
jgi:hypothetical protein